jgi:hypothetical protein
MRTIFVCVHVYGPVSTTLDNHPYIYRRTVHTVNACCSVFMVVTVRVLTGITKRHLWNVCLDEYCSISLCQKKSCRVQHRLAHIVHEG